MKVRIWVSILLIVTSAFAADIIKNGSATEECLYDLNGWRTENGVFTGTGGNLTAARTVRGDDFEASGSIALQKVGHTAAGLVVGDVIWGMDSGNTGTKMFVEDAKGTSLLEEAGNLFGDGEFFDFQLRGNKGVMTLFINNRRIGEFACDPQKDYLIALRPWRATMMVKSFSVNGTFGKLVSGTKEPQLLTSDFASIEQNLTVNLPAGTVLQDGRCQGFLQSGENGKIAFSGTILGSSLTVPSSALQKAYASAGNAPKARHVRLEFMSGNEVAFCGVVLLFDPSVKSDFAKGEIRVQNGRPRIFVNDHSQGFIAGRFSNYYGNPVFLSNSFRQFAEAGVNGHILLLYPYQDMKNATLDTEAIEKKFSAHVARVLTINPDANFFVQISLLMPESWVDANPDELVKLDNNLNTVANRVSWKCQPSYASQVWRRDAAAMLESLLAALRQTPYADRIASISPIYANAGEWNHWGYHEQAFVDYSKPMQNAFRTWLKKRYPSNEALQKTWGAPEITFESDNLVPPRAIRNSGTPPLRIGEKQAMWAADYYTFFNEYAADTIAWYGSIVKKASDRRLLYGTYYGYYFGHYNSGPYHFQDSGHYGVGKLLNSPDVDWYGGPYTYGDRLSHLECNGIVNSAALHGKLWMSEEDTRTHLSNEKQYGATANLDETLAVMKRNLMLNLQRGGSCYYHDFTKDWYRDPEVMSLISTFQKLENTLCDFKSFTPEVAVIFSEEVVPHLIPARALGLWRSMMESAHRWNVPYDEYLLSDLDKIDFSKYKMVIFANTYCADKTILAKVKQNIAGGGRTLVFFYLPGVITPEGQVDLKQSEELTGIPITFTTEATPFSWVSAIKQKDYRYQHAAIPLTSVPDANCGAEMFGMLSNGTPAMAVKKNPDWTSVVIYHPMPDPVFMRDLFDMFKIHKYASGKSGLDDVLMRPPLYAVYSKIGGSKRVFLNKKADIVVELFNGQIIGRNLYGFDFEMERHLDCKVFFAGSIDEYLIIKNAMGNQSAKYLPDGNL